MKNEDVELEESIKQEAMNLLTGCTDSRFFVDFQSDCSRKHVAAIIERSYDWAEDLSDFLPRSISEIRVVMMFVPEGYIEAFYLD